jgi:hypothetical protein
MPDGSSIGPRDEFRDLRIGMAFVLIPSSIAIPHASRRRRRVLRAGWIAPATHPAEIVQDRVRPAA